MQKDKKGNKGKAIVAGLAVGALSLFAPGGTGTASAEPFLSPCGSELAGQETGIGTEGAPGPLDGAAGGCIAPLG